MFTLYKKKPDGKLLYAEYWIEDRQLVEHAGTVGTLGTTSRIDFPANIIIQTNSNVIFYHGILVKAMKKLPSKRLSSYSSNIL
ncbi:hypothetical protein J2W91_000527 [Paenibacillus amylolyticus]|uniref:Uncharacterized protein n=1 Tax=Paenibacillus amylolyticus TaxID=1451 RepID=A0AAP5GWY9_PAEAM|nr:hypothetical protein [Paenibacillus amylolyticus]MDR6722079.1 hypothetical protein [Paenibacillus amylolyticus]